MTLSDKTALPLDDLTLQTHDVDGALAERYSISINDRMIAASA